MRLFIAILILFPLVSSSQFKYYQLCRYINMPTDSLDNILTKNGFEFKGIEKENDKHFGGGQMRDLVCLVLLIQLL
jgi:hypothetical protein